MHMGAEAEHVWTFCARQNSLHFHTFYTYIYCEAMPWVFCLIFITKSSEIPYMLTSITAMRCAVWLDTNRLYGIERMVWFGLVVRTHRFSASIFGQCHNRIVHTLAYEYHEIILYTGHSLLSPEKCHKILKYPIQMVASVSVRNPLSVWLQ